MKKVLFLCSGNYYRSRFAEVFFNSLAAQQGLAWQAESRGLAIEMAANLGPISCAVVARLKRLGIELRDGTRFPIQVTQTDLSGAQRIIAMKEAEHRQMLSEQFPDWTDRVEYWRIDDLDCAEPETALPLLESKLRRLLHALEP